MMECDRCGKVHPELQLDTKVRAAVRWYEKTGQEVVVIKTNHGYDFTTTKDPELSHLRLELFIPGGFVQ